MMARIPASMTNVIGRRTVRGWGDAGASVRSEPSVIEWQLPLDQYSADQGPNSWDQFRRRQQDTAGIVASFRPFCGLHLCHGYRPGPGRGPFLPVLQRDP